MGAGGQYQMLGDDINGRFRQVDNRASRCNHCQTTRSRIQLLQSDVARIRLITDVTIHAHRLRTCCHRDCISGQQLNTLAGSGRSDVAQVSANCILHNGICGMDADCARARQCVIQVNVGNRAFHGFLRDQIDIASSSGNLNDTLYS